MKMMKIVSSSFLALIAAQEPARNESMNMLRAVGTYYPHTADFQDPAAITVDFMNSGQPQSDQCLYINRNNGGWYDWYCDESSWQGALCEWRGSSRPSYVGSSWTCKSDGSACFYNIATSMTWWDAHTACEALGADIYLARTLDQAEQDILDSFYVISWIAGFREDGSTNQWYWSHGGLPAAPAAAAAPSHLEFYAETDALTILEHMLLENGISDGQRRRKRQAGATDTNADTVSSISDQMALTGCWCPKLNEFNYNAKGEARDDYDQKCRHMASCLRRVNECGACNGIDISDDYRFYTTYDAVANTFECNVNAPSACQVALCTCQMEWGVSVIEQIKADGNVMKSEAANLDVSDTCVASSDSWTFVC